MTKQEHGVNLDDFVQKSFFASERQVEPSASVTHAGPSPLTRLMEKLIHCRLNLTFAGKPEYNPIFVCEAVADSPGEPWLIAREYSRDPDPEAKNQLMNLALVETLHPWGEEAQGVFVKELQLLLQIDKPQKQSVSLCSPCAEGSPRHLGNFIRRLSGESASITLCREKRSSVLVNLKTVIDSRSASWLVVEEYHSRNEDEPGLFLVNSAHISAITPLLQNASALKKTIKEMQAASGEW